jgi:hypothetical protein
LLNNGLVFRERLAFAPSDGSDPTAPFEQTSGSIAANAIIASA